MSAAIGVLASSASFAQVWQNVDQFSLAPGLSALAGSISTAPNGNTLYSAGSAQIDAGGNSVAIVRKSTDSGATWTTVDNYLEEEWPFAHYRAVHADANGTVLAGGELWDRVPNTGTKEWFVRESHDGGASWTTVDGFMDGAGGKPSCGDVKINPYTGDTFAVGHTAVGGDTSKFYWVVRKREAGAGTFQTVEEFTEGGVTVANAVGFHPTGGVLVVGSSAKGTSSWVVRRSNDGGVTWVTVDRYNEKSNASARGITVSSSGVIYVCGQAVQYVKGQPYNNWVVRRSLDDGTTWATMDRWGAELAPYGYGKAIATGITATPSGNVYVTGVTADPSRMVVRKGTTASNGKITWTTISDYQLAPGQPAQNNGIASDIYGSLFTAGKAQINSSGLTRFLTRKLLGPQ